MTTRVEKKQLLTDPPHVPHAGKILLVDDDVDLVVALSERLKAAGFLTFQAHDGASGIALAFRERPELVLLDVMMPHVDGFEACAALKRGLDGYSPKVMILSAVAQGTGRSPEALKAESGADAFLYKPFDGRRLSTEIARLLLRQ